MNLGDRTLTPNSDFYGLCEVAVGVALPGLVDEAAAAVAPIEIAAGTTMLVPAAAAVVTTVAPAAWPPTTAPAAGACAMVVAGAAGTTVCATATPVAAIADNRSTNLMTESPEKVSRYSLVAVIWLLTASASL
jgi:hypothetical protein